MFNSVCKFCEDSLHIIDVGEKKEEIKQTLIYFCYTETLTVAFSVIFHHHIGFKYWIN